MTNEEKAVVMGLHVRDLCISKGVTRDNAETASLLVQQSAMEMAEWKDQQFKEYLVNKLKKNFQDFNLNYYSRYRQPYELFQEGIEWLKSKL